MVADSDYPQDLINRPTESLSIELKGWINPNTPEGKDKIVRAAIAMRNHGGGYVLIGFHNDTGEPYTDNIPSNVRKLFHQDNIQRIVSKYSSELFEVKVHFPIRDGIEFPVIEIKAGVKTPVATKRPLKNNQGEVLFQENKVFIRSLAANNTPSTTEATWKDWPNIVEACFENREADIGSFVRRHLRTLPPEFFHALSSFVSLVSKRESKKLYHIIPRGQPEKPAKLPPIEEKITEKIALAYLQESAKRFTTVVEEQNLSLPEHGSWEVSAVIIGDVPSHSANISFLNLLDSSNPNYTGWPVWLDSRGFTNQEAHPYVFQGVWEAFICYLGTELGGKHLDFWRLHPSGKFYLWRALQDDLSNSERAPEPLKELDFGLVILRTAETIAVALEFGKAMGCPIETTNLSFVFRWTKMKGRELSSWANINRHMPRGYIAKQDDITSQVTIPLETPGSAIAEYVHLVTKTVFEAFSGEEISISVIEDLTQRLIERRL
jgi:hypothetical protein